jgi:hypothetical protein
MLITRMPLWTLNSTVRPGLRISIFSGANSLPKLGSGNVMFPSASAGRCSSHAKSTSVRPPAAGQRGANSTAPASSLLRSSAEWSAWREVAVGKSKIHGLSADPGFRLPSFPTFPHEHPLSCFFWLRRKTTIQPVPGRTAPLDEEPVEEEEEDRAQEQRPFRNRPGTGTTRRPNRILRIIAEWISSPAKGGRRGGDEVELRAEAQ